MNKQRTTGYICILLSSLIFSTAEVILKTVAGVFAPLQITAVRFFIGGLVLLPFAVRSLRKKEMKLQRGDYLYFWGVGCLNVVLAMTVFQLSVVYAPASVVAVLFSSNALFTVILAGLLLHEKLKLNHFLALAIEVLAILFIIDPFNGELSASGVALSLISAVIFALYSVAARTRAARYGGIAITSIAFILGGLSLMGLILLGRIPAVSSFLNNIGLSIMADVPLFKGIPAYALPQLIYICLVVSGIGFVCHALGLEKTSASEGALVFFMKPMFAPFFALLILHERIEWNMWVGIVLFLIGSGLSVVPKIIEERKAQKAVKA